MNRSLFPFLLSRFLILTMAMPLSSALARDPAAGLWGEEGIPRFGGYQRLCWDVLKHEKILFDQKARVGFEESQKLPTGDGTPIALASEFALQLDTAGFISTDVLGHQVRVFNLEILHLTEEDAARLPQVGNPIPILVTSPFLVTSPAGVQILLTPQAKREASSDPEALTARLKEAVALLYASHVFAGTQRSFNEKGGSEIRGTHHAFLPATRALAGRFLHLMKTYEDWRAPELSEHLIADLTQEFVAPYWRALKEGESWADARQNVLHARTQPDLEKGIAGIQDIDLEPGQIARLDSEGQLSITSNESTITIDSNLPFFLSGERELRRSTSRSGSGSQGVYEASGGQALHGLAANSQGGVVLETHDEPKHFRLIQFGFKGLGAGATVLKNVLLNDLGWTTGPRSRATLLSPDGRYFAYYSDVRGLWVIDLAKLNGEEDRAVVLDPMRPSPWIVQLSIGNDLLRSNRNGRFVDVAFTPDSSHLNLVWQSGFIGDRPRFISVRLEKEQE